MNPRKFRTVLLGSLLAAAALLLGCTRSINESANAETKAGVNELPPVRWQLSQAFRMPGSEPVDPAQLIKELARADYILIGEIHDNPRHHLNQAFIIENLDNEIGLKAAVFEMIDQSLADRIIVDNGYRTDIDRLRVQLGWDDSGWPSWIMYKPVFAAVLSGNIEIVAGNLPYGTIAEVVRQKPGESFPDQLKGLPLDFDLTQTQQKALTEDLVEGHCGLIPEQATRPMARAQRARDAKMAAALSGAGGKSVLIAGNGHTQKIFGVPVYLKRLSDKKALSIGQYEVEFTAGKPKAKDMQNVLAELDEGLHDYIILTPPTARPDPCEKLRRQFRQHHRQ